MPIVHFLYPLIVINGLKKNCCSFLFHMFLRVRNLIKFEERINILVMKYITNYESLIYFLVLKLLYNHVWLPLYLCTNYPIRRKNVSLKRNNQIIIIRRIESVLCQKSINICQRYQKMKHGSLFQKWHLFFSISINTKQFSQNSASWSSRRF